MVSDATLLPWFVGAIGVFGLLIGSFLNVVIWRVPRGESLLPASHCPQCDAPIRPWQNVPVLSWLALRGRCASCKAPIRVRYPLVELGTGVAFALVAWWWVNWAPLTSARSANGLPVTELVDVSGTALPALEATAWWLALAAFLWLAAVAIALALIDLELQRLPDAIVLPSIGVVAGLLGLAAALAGDWARMGSTLGGAAALFGFYLVIALVYPRGIGGGDVKLAPVLGAALGFVSWGALVVGAFAGFLLGALSGLLLIGLGRATRRTALPFGPFMLLGAWIGIVWGDAILAAYLRLVGLA